MLIITARQHSLLCRVLY